MAIYVVSSVKDALAKIGTNRYDAIVSDCHMP